MDVTVTFSGGPAGLTVVSFELPLTALVDDVMEAAKELEIMADDGDLGVRPAPNSPYEALVVFGSPFRVHVMLFPGASKAKTDAFIDLFTKALDPTAAVPTVTRQNRSPAKIQAWWGMVESGPL